MRSKCCVLFKYFFHLIVYQTRNSASRVLLRRIEDSEDCVVRTPSHQWDEEQRVQTTDAVGTKRLNLCGSCETVVPHEIQKFFPSITIIRQARTRLDSECALRRQKWAATIFPSKNCYPAKSAQRLGRPLPRCSRHSTIFMAVSAKKIIKYYII